ncbi:MAG: cytochrome B [Cyclobacteriaceae bacterium]
MYTGLLHTHSLLRYAVLLLLIAVVVTALLGWLKKKEYSTSDNKLSLYLFIATHVQLLVGLILYTQSSWVRFGKLALKIKEVRYWTMEHVTIMVLAIVLITMARISAKKLTSAEAKHKRMFIFNAIALILIVVGLVMSGRGIV